jgi:hypothetical protein
MPMPKKPYAWQKQQNSWSSAMWTPWLKPTGDMHSSSRPCSSSWSRPWHSSSSSSSSSSSRGGQRRTW